VERILRTKNRKVYLSVQSHQPTPQIGVCEVELEDCGLPLGPRFQIPKATRRYGMLRSRFVWGSPTDLNQLDAPNGEAGGAMPWRADSRKEPTEPQSFEKQHTAGLKKKGSGEQHLRKE